MVAGACRERRAGAIEPAVPPAAEPHRRRSAERDADDMLEHGAVAMPADASTPDRSGSAAPARDRLPRARRMPPRAPAAAEARQESARSDRSSRPRSRSASRTMRSAVCRASPGSGTAQGPSRRSRRSVRAPQRPRQAPRAGRGPGRGGGRTDRDALRTSARYRKAAGRPPYGKPLRDRDAPSSPRPLDEAIRAHGMIDQAHLSADG